MIIGTSASLGAHTTDPATNSTRLTSSISRLPNMFTDAAGRPAAS